MSVILGLNCFHADTAACLVVDGQLIAAVAEERLGERLKHDPRFPRNAIACVLQQAGLEFKDITHIAMGHNPQATKQAKIRYTLSNPISSAGAVVEHFKRRQRGKDEIRQLAEDYGQDPDHPKFEVVRVEHHLAHIASSYYLSPFEKLTAGFSYDASGDFCSAMIARCEGHQIDVLERVYLPHSLGFFYTAVCQFIGFTDFGEEYKVMGLASYGKDEYRQAMEQLVHLPPDGMFELAKGYFGMHSGGQSGELTENQHLVMGQFYTDKMRDLFGEPNSNKKELGEREENIARSCQARFEEAAMHCFKRAHKLVPTNQIAYAGGCALNGVANARMLRDTPFDTPYLQCASSDDGTCLGAAYWTYHNVVGGQQRFHMQTAYWGPSHSQEQMNKAARACNMPMAEDLEDQQTIDLVATLLREGLILGWYQGRSEWGPRALGNRSILADPSDPQTKDRINTKIKRRERFRPFAPSVLKDHVSTYFEQDVLSPFMMHVVKIKPQWQEKLPAVTHVDGTGRLQSIERANNPRYYDLIKAFGDRSGVYMLLNTSFNENEPIVDTPQQAVDCFTRTDMDAICLGNTLVVKPELAELLERHRP